MNEGVETIEELARSEARVKLLEAISNEQGLNEREIRDKLSFSRATIQRNLKILSERRWIQNRDGQYVTSTCGDLIIEKFLNVSRTAEAVERLQPFLQYVPKSEFELELTYLRDATLTVSEPGDPLKMVNRHVDSIRSTNELYAVLPITSLHPLEVLHRRILQGSLRSEVVVSKAVAETFRTDSSYANLIEEIEDLDEFQIYVFDDNIPLYIGILDNEIQLGADNNGEPKALVETESDKARSWAKTKFKYFKYSSEEY